MKPIWIVDDDESIRWVLEKALARENLATRSFSNVRDAVTALESGTPQVLVSDIRTMLKLMRLFQNLLFP
jgi:two-component system nitrogen regulation response regulator GlnG